MSPRLTKVRLHQCLAAEDGAEPVFPRLSHMYDIDLGSKQDLDTVDYLNLRPDGGIVVGSAK